MDRAAPDAVIGEPAVAVERLKIEGPLALELLALHARQEARQFVADQQQAARILVQKFAQLFDCGVIDDDARTCGIVIGIGI